MNHKNKIFYIDDDYEPISLLMKLRMPALFVGLILGVGISFMTSRFEEVLSKNVQIAFFMPFVVYLAAAVGSQTVSIYLRDLKTGHAKFSNYFWKELVLGIIFGAIFGLFSAGIVLLWFKNDLLAESVGTATFFAIMFAPVVALLITYFSQLIGQDPAAGSGPIEAVIQDVISVTVYGVVCSWIIL